MTPTLFGVPLNLILQGGILSTLLILVAGIITVWIKGMPERMRVALEHRAIAATEAAQRFKEWRNEVHALKNELAIVAAKQAGCDKALSEAHAINRANKGQTNTMLFIIRLLISELKRLDPQSIIVRQAEETLAHMQGSMIDPAKSQALNTAEGAVQDAKQTLASTQDTCAEVKRTEGENGK
jgi:hypothetical protein